MSIGFWVPQTFRLREGVWIYTKDKHSGELEDTFYWEKEDALLVQINDPKYKNNELKVSALQIVDDETVKIVVSFTPIENPSEEKTPRRYATIEKDSLKGKKFIVESQEGEAVKLN